VGLGKEAGERELIEESTWRGRHGMPHGHASLYEAGG